MTLPAPTYDLVLLLDPQADDATRAQVVADSRASIEAQGELLRHDDWGERALTDPIDRKASAQYHLLQFHVADKQLLSGLDRTLRLADEVLRFRIIKLAPGVAAPPDMSSGATTAARRTDEAVEAPPETPQAEAQTPEPAAEEPAVEPAPAAEAAPEAAESAPEAAQPDAEVAVGEPS
ncbi:MAG TPA: 30S ribosomal protein S6 [Solirubrobacteraceae bacterium]|nr:30S ribosomal protein S6 [Solirubrobacteraceae bacterium]